MLRVSHLSRIPPALLLLLSLIVFPSLAGCKPRMQPPDTIALPDGTYQVHIDTSKPLRFYTFSFGVASYDTYGLQVIYDGRYAANENPDAKQTASAEIEGDYREYMQALWVGREKLGVAEVKWRDKDGQPLEARVDLSEVFKDRLILHKVPQDQLPPVIGLPIMPDVILEVNNRAVRVWMRAHVPTSVLQKPGNPYSDFRDDVMLAYEKIY